MPSLYTSRRSIFCPPWPLLTPWTVSCENANKSPLTISALLEPRYYEFVTDDKDRIRIVAPFTNQKCRVVVRVTDFSPNEIERFSVSRKISEFDYLSDNESSDNEDPLSDEGDAPEGPRTWEWSFSLQLEDASAEAGPTPARVWAHVDNTEAQCLTGLNASEYVPPSIAFFRLH